MNATLGLIYSQRVLLKLIDNGMTREAAYDLVPPKTAYAWDNQTDSSTPLARAISNAKPNELIFFRFLNSGS